MVETPELARDLIELVPLPLEGAGAASLWLVSLDVADGAAGPLRELLSPEERARADNYPHAARGRRFAMGRAALRLLLGSALTRDPRSLSFVANVDGKPALEADGRGAASLQFNVSHAGDLLLIALSWGRPVGVDLSAVHERLPVDAVARRFFSDVERSYLASARVEDERRLRFAQLWVRKEAWLKGVGRGITARMRETDFSVASDRSTSEATFVVRTPDGWELRDVHGLPPGHVGAVAMQAAQAPVEEGA